MHIESHKSKAIVKNIWSRVRVVATTTTYIRSILFSRAIHTKAYIASYTVMQLMTLWFLIKNIAFFPQRSKIRKMMDENPVNFRNVSNEGKTYFQGEIQGEKEVKVIISFWWFIVYITSQIDNALISCSSTTKMYLVRIQYIQIVLCVIDRARSRGWGF